MEILNLNEKVAFAWSPLYTEYRFVLELWFE